MPIENIQHLKQRLRKACEEVRRDNIITATNTNLFKQLELYLREKTNQITRCNAMAEFQVEKVLIMTACGATGVAHSQSVRCRRTSVAGSFSFALTAHLVLSVTMLCDIFFSFFFFLFLFVTHHSQN